MMSLTSSLGSPPNVMETVESGCDPAGAEYGCAENEVMLNSPSAGGGAMSSASAVAAPAAQLEAARRLSSHESIRPIAGLNGAPLHNLRKTPSPSPEGSSGP